MIAAHPAKVKVVCMGRRWGKTMMAGSVALSCAAHGAAVAWIPPTYKNARPLWRFAEQMTAPVSKRLRINRTDRTIEFPGGGWLGIYTADNPVGILGEAFDLVILEEAARIAEDVWSETIMPTLADRDGRAMLISTPRGRNWFWREYQAGLADGKTQASFTAPSNANPMPQIQRAFEMARTRVSERTFRQEWEAQFLDDGGGVFRRVQEAATIPQAIEPIAGHQYVIGVDWARSTDSTWFCVIDATTHENVLNDRMTGTDYQIQRSRLLALHNRYYHAPVLAEYNSIGGPQLEALQNMGVTINGFVTTNATKAQIIDALALAFEQEQINICNDPILIGELQAYESKRSSTGLVTYNAPDGMHDDGVIALALAWYASSTNQVQIFL